VTVVLWGARSDGPLRAVLSRLRALGADVLLLDQLDMDALAVDLDLARQATGTVAAAGTLRAGSRRLSLDQVTALYLRPYDIGSLPALADCGPGSPAWEHAVRFEEAMCLWSELSGCLVVNRPSAMASNDSKPFQLQLIAACGLRVPDTLVTTDATAAAAFRARYKDVIYKSVSGRRSIVSRVSPAHDVRMSDLRWCPTQFQQHVPGTDYRVHVICGELYATEIRSAADDYRYATSDGVSFRAADLDGGLAERLAALVRTLGLHVAGIDLRRTPDGGWYCLEVNPSPAFTYYEQATGQPIAASIARALAHAGSR
jgi:hypothetical protein